MVFMNIALLRGSIALYSYTQRLPFKQKYNDRRARLGCCTHDKQCKCIRPSRLRPTEKNKGAGPGHRNGRGTLLPGAEVASQVSRHPIRGASSPRKRSITTRC